ncbi:LysO family transporter [Desulfovibrio legallii]|jgi:uncharacterized membrane protein YadS|uniref:DUF340 domain-containing protein n=1 Tax=Desulfovibrio legallii TaxID=571438 RepID=A0A1G7R362_9BACT|nr:LysO family transporter [Desulfovibrio legallii]SDG04390.1 hypothetical protein SAMN05192586_12612 [Desulfovibrio legallii]
MFIALGLTFLGMAVGFLLRKGPWPGRLTRGITPVIMLLLLGLGIAVGGNAALMEALPRLGGAALALTLAGVAGSLVCTLLAGRLFRRGPGSTSAPAHANEDTHEDC